MSSTNGRRVFGRSDIGSVKLKTEYVDVPEWGEGACVLVREMNSVEALTINSFNEPDQNARIAAMVLVNEDGSQMYDYKNPDDIQELARQNADAIRRIGLTGIRLSGRSQKQIEDALKNSEASLNADSAGA